MSVQAKPLLAVQHLSLAFGNVTAIDDLSFTVHERQITTLIGPEGAGKTSVLNCLTGINRRIIGRIELHCGQQQPLLLERMEPSQIARDARVVRTFRNPRIFPGMTVLENVLVAQNNRFSPSAVLSRMAALPAQRRVAMDKARTWLDKVGLSQDAGRIAGGLGHGLQRRLEIARALATEPCLICMDEPATGSSGREIDQLASILLDLKAQGIALLVTAQEPGIAEMLGDQVIVLDHGQCIATGTGRELSHRSAVLRAYLGLPPGAEMMPRIAVSC